MHIQGNDIIISQEMLLLNTLAMGIAVQILEKETTYTKEEWQIFLQSNAQRQYDSMSPLDRALFIQGLMASQEGKYERN